MFNLWEPYIKREHLLGRTRKDTITAVLITIISLDHHNNCGSGCERFYLYDDNI